MKALLVTFCALIALTGCSLSRGSSDDSKNLQIVRANSARTKAYHELADKVNEEQALLQDFISIEAKKCQVEKKILQLNQTGDLACVEAPPAATAPAVPTVPKKP
jgi:hypothetical protein